MLDHGCSHGLPVQRQLAHVAHIPVHVAQVEVPVTGPRHCCVLALCVRVRAAGVGPCELSTQAWVADNSGEWSNRSHDGAILSLGDRLERWRRPAPSRRCLFWVRGPEAISSRRREGVVRTRRRRSRSVASEPRQVPRDLGGGRSRQGSAEPVRVRAPVRDAWRRVRPRLQRVPDRRLAVRLEAPSVDPLRLTPRTAPPCPPTAPPRSESSSFSRSSCGSRTSEVRA